MMNTEAKQQYMETLRERYLKGSKKRKGEMLDEYCRNTGQERIYVGKKFRYKVKRKEVYESLNPAELKRNLDKKLRNLYKVYQKKKGLPTVVADKKLTASMMSFHMMNLK